MRPKLWGELGIKDLDKFGRALRLRWMWHMWDYTDKPWKKLLKFQDTTDRQLFFASAYVDIGDGKNTPFWEAKWINGASPKELAPTLYNLARYKFRTVHKKLHNRNWIKNLTDIESEEAIQEYVLLHSLLQQITLSNEKDKIYWKWTANKKYSAASAYNVQFLEAFQQFSSVSVESQDGA